MGELGIHLKHGSIEDGRSRRSGGDARRADASGMLRTLQPLEGSDDMPLDRKRHILARVVRSLGVEVIGTEVAAPVAPAAAQPPASAVSGASGTSAPSPLRTGVALSPRLAQTFGHLLAGQSEKEVAGALQLSPHTVHVYVKALYRRFNVSSRAELLARHLHR